MTKCRWLSVKPSLPLSKPPEAQTPWPPVEWPLGAALTHSSLPVNVSDQMLCSTSSALSKSMDITEMIYDRVITQRQDDARRWEGVAERYCTKLSSAFNLAFHCNTGISRRWWHNIRNHDTSVFNFMIFTLHKLSSRAGIKGAVSDSGER